MPQLTGWRRIASAMWPAPNDPQIYGTLELEAGRALEFIKAARAAGHYLTPTHLVGKAVALALEAVPDLNVRIVGTRAIPRPKIEIFFITAVEGGRDLSGVKLADLQRRSVVEVAAELRARAASARAGSEREFSRSKRGLDALPLPLLRLALHVSALLSQRMQLDLPSLSLRKNPFGSAMITSVGMFGIPHGFAPLSWMYDVPLLVLVGEIAERPVVVNKQVVARPIVPLTATIDHRYVDGAQLARAARVLRAYLEDPAAHEPPLRLNEQTRA